MEECKDNCTEKAKPDYSKFKAGKTFRFNRHGSSYDGRVYIVVETKPLGLEHKVLASLHKGELWSDDTVCSPEYIDKFTEINCCFKEV